MVRHNLSQATTHTNTKIREEERQKIRSAIAGFNRSSTHGPAISSQLLTFVLRTTDCLRRSCPFLCLSRPCLIQAPATIVNAIKQSSPAKQDHHLRTRRMAGQGRSRTIRAESDRAEHSNSCCGGGQNKCDGGWNATYLVLRSSFTPPTTPQLCMPNRLTLSIL